MKTIVALVLLYLLFLALLTLFQRKLIYIPYALERDFTFPRYVPGLEEAFMTCADGYTINGLFAPGSENKPTVLIFHGNAGNITHRDFLIRGFHSLGYSVLIIDYHGYGKSEGAPSEENLYLDGEAARAWLGKEKNTAPGDTVLFGKSLGSGVAIELATRHTFKGLIVESGFTSLASVARSHFPYNCFPVSLMLRDRFDNSTKIAAIHVPLLITHGTEDSIVDRREGERLFELANRPKELYLVEGADHNTMQSSSPGYWARVAAWLEDLP